MDNILLSQELLRNSHRESPCPRCAIKVDFQKAYDSNNWNFILDTLHCYNFWSIFIQWIRTCITTPSFSIQNISTLVSIKLTETNYLLWKGQIQPFLIGPNLWPFVDGSFPCPPPFFPSYDGKTMNLNPSYTSWVQTDQTLVSLINATLTESVLALLKSLVFKQTSRDVWSCLQPNFSQQSLANASNLRFQPLSGNQSISQYLQHAKILQIHWLLSTNQSQMLTLLPPFFVVLAQIMLC